MRTAPSCGIGAFHRQGAPIVRRRHAGERPRPGGVARPARCGDCGVAVGGHHHPGCDLEPCCVCGHQALTCGCLFDEDGDIEAGHDA